jgi:hypothetical protein
MDPSRRFFTPPAAEPLARLQKNRPISGQFFCGGPSETQLRAVNAASGFQATRWFGSHLGFEMRFLLGFLGYGKSRKFSPYDFPDWGKASNIVEIHFSLGLSFR